MTARERDIAAEIRRIAREELGVEVALEDGDELAGRLDSLALLSLVVAIEDRWRFRLGDEDAAAARTLADVARLVARRTGQAAGEAAP